MEMDHVAAPCPLVEIVDILRHDGDIVVLLQLGEELVSGIGLSGSAAEA